MFWWESKTPCGMTWKSARRGTAATYPNPAEALIIIETFVLYGQFSAQRDSKLPALWNQSKITLTANRMLLPSQLRGIWKRNFGNSFSMKCQGLDVKMQCDETVSIKYQINSFFKMVTEAAYVPLKLHTHTACYWQFTHETDLTWRKVIQLTMFLLVRHPFSPPAVSPLLSALKLPGVNG